MCCRPRGGGCNPVTRRCLRGLSSVLINLDVQRYNTSTTDRDRRQGLEIAMGHRRLSTNVSVVCRWQSVPWWPVYLASVDRRHRHKALAAKVSVWHIQTILTVSNINSLVDDVTGPSSTDTVRLSRWWTKTSSTTARHGTTSRRRVTDWVIYRQSLQQTTEPGSGRWSQQCRWGATWDQWFTSIITQLHWTHRCWLSGSHTCSGPAQSSYSAAWQSTQLTSHHHRRTSAEQRVATASVLQRTIRTTVGWVGHRRRGVWCAVSLDELFNISVLVIISSCWCNFILV